MVDMKRMLLAALGYRLGEPTTYTFVEHFTRGYSQEEGDVEPELRFAHDFASVSLLHYGCLELKQSVVAAAAMFADAEAFLRADEELEQEAELGSNGHEPIEFCHSKAMPIKVFETH